MTEVTKDEADHIASNMLYDPKVCNHLWRQNLLSSYEDTKKLLSNMIFNEGMKVVGRYGYNFDLYHFRNNGY